MTDHLPALSPDEPAPPVGSFVRIAILEAAIIVALWILSRLFS